MYGRAGCGEVVGGARVDCKNMQTENQFFNDHYAWDVNFVLSQVAQADFSSKSGRSVILKTWDDLDE